MRMLTIISSPLAVIGLTVLVSIVLWPDDRTADRLRTLFCTASILGLTILDWRALQAAGYHISSGQRVLAIFLWPVWLFVRAKRSNQTYWCPAVGTMNLIAVIAVSFATMLIIPA